MSADFRAYYSVVNAEEFRALGLDWPAFYERADRMSAEARRALASELDIAFGPDPKQMLDVYRASVEDPDQGVVVFFHGGGFREGDRAHYGFVAAELAEQGITTVIPSYRLLPQSSLADAVADSVAAVRWSAERFPERNLVLVGHSAGGILAGLLGADPVGLLGAELDPARVVGIVPMSATYDLGAAHVPDYLMRAAGDESQRSLLSPLARIRRPVARALVVAGGAEGPYVPEAEQFAQALRAGRCDASGLLLPGQRHDQTPFALVDRASQVFAGLLALASAPARRTRSTV